MKKQKRTKTESKPLFSKEEVLLDAQCGKLEDDEGLETLRFVKFAQIAPAHITTLAAEKLINEYREQDALAFARTIKKLLTEDNKNFRDMLLDNAEARLREYNNRPK